MVEGVIGQTFRLLSEFCIKLNSIDQSRSFAVLAIRQKKARREKSQRAFVYQGIYCSFDLDHDCCNLIQLILTQESEYGLRTHIRLCQRGG